MKNNWISVFAGTTLFLILFLVMPAKADIQAQHFSPVGKWKTIDDITHQEKSIIQITETDSHTLSGQVIKLFPAAMTRCEECKDEKKNKPILGMVVLMDLKQNKKIAALWEDGEIFNPKNGKTYWSQIRVIEDGKKLQVRGYIGLPLFGRTQTWVRV